MRRLPTLTLILPIFWLVAGFFTNKPKSSFDFRGFGELPVLNGGRTKPLDSLARNSLLLLSGKQTVRTTDGTLAAVPWLLDVLFHRDKAMTHPVFTIDNPDVLGVLGIAQTDKRRFSYNDILPHFHDLAQQAKQAESVKAEQRSGYQSAVLNL